MTLDQQKSQDRAYQLIISQLTRLIVYLSPLPLTPTNPNPVLHPIERRHNVLKRHYHILPTRQETCLTRHCHPLPLSSNGSAAPKLHPSSFPLTALAILTSRSIGIS